MKKITLLLSIWNVVFAAQAQPPLSIEVSAGKYGRANTPIWVTLTRSLPLNQTYQLVNRKTGKSTPAQLIDSNTLVFILPDSLAPGMQQTYSLSNKKRTGTPAVAIESKDYGLLITSHNKPVLFYHTKESLPPVDTQAYYRRSGFIHPLYSPTGKVLTDDFPAGHAHQHAIFMAWTNTTFRKQFVDFWNQQHRKGTVEHVEVVKTLQGPVVAQLQVKLRHRSLAHGEVLQEWWTISVYPFSNFFLFDLISEQRNVTNDTLYLNKYHYGGLGFRGNRAWNQDDSINYKSRWEVTTSEGIKDSLANHTRARWVDASGLINGEKAGATVFDHPFNFRYPQPIRVHPVMPYWVYSPVVTGAFTLDPGVPYRSRYRYLVHNGEMNAALTAQTEKDWIEPPGVKVNY